MSITQENYSGEFFDLSIPSTNNIYGFLHNKGLFKYGINFPLLKFIEELKKILSESPDDKSVKRQVRLDFLQFCDALPELQFFFTSFCNYLNGKTGRGEQYTNFIVVTAAGGNIIIVFAQLIMNIIESYGDGGVGATAEQAATALAMFNSLLMPTNEILLTILTIIRNIDRLGIARLIVAHFESAPKKYEELKEIAESPPSDCDFKLSPNIYSASGESDIITVMKWIGRMDIGDDTVSTPTMVPTTTPTMTTSCPPLGILKGGFLLFRVKSLIDCSKDYESEYTHKQLREFKNACQRTTKYKNLYPQIITKKHLHDAETEGVDSNCLKHLQHLYKKKETIKYTTQLTINQARQFETTGLIKKSNTDGSTYAIVPSAKNFTEAIIRYIRRITIIMNAYIEMQQDYKLERQTYKSLWSNFESLNHIILCHNKRIPNLAADIVNYFLNYPDFYSEDILDKLIANFNEQNSSKCTMPPADILLVPSKEYTDLCYYPLVSIKEKLEKTLYSPLGYPDGVRITINALVSEQLLDITDFGLNRLNAMEKITIQEIEQKQKDLRSDGYRPPRDITKKTGTTYRNSTMQYDKDDDDDDDDDEEEEDDDEDDDKRDRNRDRDRDEDVRAWPGRGGYNKGKKKFTLKKKMVKKTQEKLKTKPKKTRRQKHLRKVTLKHKKSRKHKSIKHKYRKHKL